MITANLSLLGGRLVNGKCPKNYYYGKYAKRVMGLVRMIIYLTMVPDIGFITFVTSVQTGAGMQAGVRSQTEKQAGVWRGVGAGVWRGRARSIPAAIWVKKW